MIVSSVAPPTKRSRCERTVTRAFTFAPIPSFRDTVDGHAAHRRVGHVDDLRINAGADSFQYRLARPLGSKIDGAGTVEIE